MSRGLDRETRVAQLLEEQGYVCGSRRHIGGAGDILAVGLVAKRLIEVKSTITPYAHFLPADRAAMSALARSIDAVAELAWWPKRGKLRFIAEDEWPKR